MEYNIIQPPFTLKFREMSKAELKNYFRWFMGVIPYRINELSKGVTRTNEYDGWQPDNTPQSLDMLGQWLSEKVETRPRTEAELAEINGRSSFPIEVPKIELTNRTFSLAMDVGMYLSQVFLQSHPSLKWTQRFSSKNSVDYGQPVLVEFTPGPFNPVGMAVTLAYGIAHERRTGQGLRELYDIWAAKVVTEP